jgi:hypothetical protein
MMMLKDNIQIEDQDDCHFIKKMDDMQGFLSKTHITQANKIIAYIQKGYIDLNQNYLMCYKRGFKIGVLRQNHNRLFNITCDDPRLREFIPFYMWARDQRIILVLHGTGILFNPAIHPYNAAIEIISQNILKSRVSRHIHSAIKVQTNTAILYNKDYYYPFNFNYEEIDYNTLIARINAQYQVLENAEFSVNEQIEHYRKTGVATPSVQKYKAGPLRETRLLNTVTTFPSQLSSLAPPYPLPYSLSSHRNTLFIAQNKNLSLRVQQGEHDRSLLKRLDQYSLKSL